MVKTGGERGRRRRSTGQGRDERFDGRGNTAHDTTCSGSPGGGTGGRRSGIGSHVGQGRCSRQKNMARQASGQRRPRRHVATAPYDTWYSLLHLQQAGKQRGRRRRQRNLPQKYTEHQHFGPHQRNTRNQNLDPRKTNHPIDNTKEDVHLSPPLYTKHLHSH